MLAKFGADTVHSSVGVEVLNTVIIRAMQYCEISSQPLFRVFNKILFLLFQ